MNYSLRYVLLLFKWSSAEWRAIYITPVDRQIVRVQVLTQAEVDMRHNQPLEVLHHHGHQYHLLVAFEACHLALLGHRFYGCPFNAEPHTLVMSG